MLKELIQNDLKRYRNCSNFSDAIKAFIFDPGFNFTFKHRLIQVIYQKGYIKIAKLLWLINSRKFGCYFHLNAQISGGLYLPHPAAIVVGENAIVGQNVTIYQNVTIGKGKGGYPNISEDVIIYPHSILFGDIYIGTNVVIGAFNLIKKDVDNDSVIISVVTNRINENK